MYTHTYTHTYVYVYVYMYTHIIAIHVQTGSSITHRPRKGDPERGDPNNESVLSHLQVTLKSPVSHF